MAKLSIGKAWEESVAFVGRESKLLFPVALLFIALPSVILQEMTPPEFATWMMSEGRKTLPPVPGSFWGAMVVTTILLWFGSLTLLALTLRPGISVGEALRLGLGRLPVLLGTAGLILGGGVLLAVVFMLVAGILATAGAALVANVLMLVLIGACLFGGIRLILLHPVVIDSHLGVVPSLRHGWALTRGHFWRLFVFLIVVMLLSFVAASATQAVFGSIAGLLADAATAKFVGGLAAAIVSTVVQVYMLVMIARLYRQAEASF